MKEQHYKNHVRIVPMFHIATGLATIAVIIGSIINLVHSSKENLYSASLLVLVSLILLSLFWHSRRFAIRAQDRAIRAEENFRHFVLTGKPLDSRLRLGQIIGLRFASDEEFPALAKKAADEGLDMDTIKKSVKSWKSDRHRA